MLSADVSRRTAGTRVQALSALSFRYRKRLRFRLSARRASSPKVRVRVNRGRETSGSPEWAESDEFCRF
eukprot:6408660-Prymnesium_polylepis.1